MSLIVGVDGTRKGWIAVVLKEQAVEDCLLFGDFGELIAAFPDAAVIGVDIPIGLLEEGIRRADTEAREFIGPRRSSVFMTPPRASLMAPTFAEALAVSREKTSSGLSRQAYALRTRILEVDALAARDPRIYEVHPEVSFAAMAGEVLPYSKKSWSGFNLRRRLLANNGITPPNEFGAGASVAPDDLLDAAAAAWSARRIAAQRALMVPSNPQLSPQGRLIAIWF